jgi:hypothetical protein
MRGQSIRSGALQIEYTSKALSGWGGLATLFEYLEQLRWTEYLRAGLPDGRTSNNQVKPVDIVRGLMATVLIGGNRFAHVDRIRQDEVIRRITGAERLPGADSLRRYFGAFNRSQNEVLYETLQKLIADLLGGSEREDVLDLDSTVLDRFGAQQGVAKGYHPTKPGRHSHHPLLGMLAEAKMIVHCWLRAGNASTHRGAVEFVDEVLSRLPPNTRLKAIRGDSGFFSKEYLGAFEERGLGYAISMKMSKPVQRFCGRIEETQWRRFDDQQQIADTTYHPPNWPSGRRVVVIRSEVHAKGADPALFKIAEYEYRVVVTTLTVPAAEVVRFYNQRGDCENRIKEFKNDFGARGFCLDSFDGTETVLRLLSVLFNLVTTFKQVVLCDSSLTLATIRSKVFVVGASIGRSARQAILRLGLVGRWRTEFGTLLERVRLFSDSTAAQLAKSLILLADASPSPWRTRRQSPAVL